MTVSVGGKFERLVEIMRVLRSPEGCPWDREQTSASLRPFILEEAYELLDAVENGGPADVREELGDFMFQAIFQAQIGSESGAFDIGDALDAICDKLVRRHPHVFNRPEGDPTLTSTQVLENWAALKARERAAAAPAADRVKTTLSGVPRVLPSLLRSFEISARAAAVGFDWLGPGDVLDKIEEEVAEVRQEIESGATGELSRAEEEMGDLLFAIANLSRKLGIEPEGALRRANEKFTRRFDAMERRFTDRGETLSAATLDEMEREWQRVKHDDPSAPQNVS